MEKFQYTTVDRVLAKYHRDLRGIDISESDAIEWIGEALRFAQIAVTSEEAVAFINVKNYQCAIPNGLHWIIQIARNNDVEELCPTDITSSSSSSSEDPIVPIALDCNGNIIGDYGVAYYRPYFDLQYEYLDWINNSTYQAKFTPVRLANHTFFNTLVCQETNQDIYQNCNPEDEYTVVGNQLRFSFKEGLIAISYLRQKVDLETGYPMIPDNEACLAAINYYLAWKVMEREVWLGRQGAESRADRAEKRWLKYVNQFKNEAFMPSTLDDYQDLMEQSMYLIPRLNRYYGFFGKLGKKEQRPFNNPQGRNKRYSSYVGYGS